MIDPLQVLLRLLDMLLDFILAACPVWHLHVVVVHLPDVRHEGVLGSFGVLGQRRNNFVRNVESV